MNVLLLMIQALLMNWFLTTIVFSVSSNSAQTQPQLREEQRLVAAHSGEEAFFKAKRIGLDLEAMDVSPKSATNALEFINVAEVRPLTENPDGAKVSTIERSLRHRSEVNEIHQKAIHLRNQLTQ